MTSLQQAPAKGQQVPPPVLIDGVSEQQIDAAVKEHVKGRRAAKVEKLAWPADPQQVIINAMLGLTAKRIKDLRDALDEDVEVVGDDAVADTVNLIAITEREVRRIQSARYGSVHEFSVDVCCLSTLIVAARNAHGGTNTLAGRILKDWDVEMMGQLDLIYQTGRA